MIEYLLKVSFVIGVVFLFYKTVLQQESFFSTNRMYLLCGITLAFALPFVTLPKLVDNQGFISEALKVTQTAEAEAASVLRPKSENQAQNRLSTGKENLAPNRETAPEEVLSPRQPVVTATTPTAEVEAPTTWVFWLVLLYLFGVAVCGLNLLFQIAGTLLKAIRSQDRIEDGDYVIVNVESKQAPCSFFKYIFIHPDDYDFETYEQIIAHEKIHVRQNHTLDLLLAEVAVILLWFNPFMWYFKKEVEKNLEYQTDALLLEKEEVSKTQYQFNLLQIACPNKPLSITTNYNQSLLKQRIFMMNAKKSTPHAFWKYTFLAPMVFGTLLLLNKPATSQTILEDVSDAYSTVASRLPQVPLLSSDPAPLSSPEAEPSPLPGGQKSILADENLPPHPGNPQAAESVLEADNPGNILPAPPRFRNRMNIIGSADMTEGFWYGHANQNEYCLDLRGKTNTSNWNISRCYPKNAFTKQGDNVYQITRDAGTLKLTGNLSEEVSQGKYVFTQDDNFRDYLFKKGIANPEDNFLFHLFLGDVNKKYVDFLKSTYNDVDGDRLQEIAIHGITMDAYQNYLAMFKKHSDKKPSMEDVISARIHGITQEYVQQLQEMGFKNLSMDKMMEAKIHGVTPAYADGLRKAGFNDLSIDKLIEAKIHGITPSYLTEVKSMGFGDFTLDKYIQLKIHGINAAYVKDLKSAGFNNLSLDKVVDAKIHGVNAKAVEELRAYGFKDLSLDKYMELRIHGVNKAYLDDLANAGFKNLPADKAIEAKIHGVNSDFIKKARQEGYNLKTLDEYINVKIMGMARRSKRD
ncbi:M56 family metallopeptidase [Rufibacter roseolus]|uniref:M56 family metallopeptidase n=1 Tax=Rufibacter roseolus TaxID=2817375 RepID=UPI001B3035CD|nr:M56 family metallopeptidase [Rufibacter roseolus]